MGEAQRVAFLQFLWPTRDGRFFRAGETMGALGCSVPDGCVGFELELDPERLELATDDEVAAIGTNSAKVLFWP